MTQFTRSYVLSLLAIVIRLDASLRNLLMIDKTSRRFFCLSLYSLFSFYTLVSFARDTFAFRLLTRLFAFSLVCLELSSIPLSLVFLSSPSPPSQGISTLDPARVPFTRRFLTLVLLMLFLVGGPSFAYRAF